MCRYVMNLKPKQISHLRINRKKYCNFGMKYKMFKWTSFYRTFVPSISNNFGYSLGRTSKIERKFNRKLSIWCGKNNENCERQLYWNTFYSTTLIRRPDLVASSWPDKLNIDERYNIYFLFQFLFVYKHLNTLRLFALHFVAFYVIAVHLCTRCSFVLSLYNRRYHIFSL